jgi:hypothetical protein
LLLALIAAVTIGAIAGGNDRRGNASKPNTLTPRDVNLNGEPV